jgi:hypothetical protein
MARADLPVVEQIRDHALLAPLVRRTARETWFDPDWLWNFAKGMQDAGLPTERTLAALERQRRANLIPPSKRFLRLVQLKTIKGFWDY